MLLTARKVRLDSSEEFLLVTDQESNGHFHWFTEVLPRLWLIKDRAPEFVLMLPDTPYMRSVAAESLQVTGIRFKEIFWVQRGEFYKVPRLYHVSKVSRTGQMDDAIMMKLNRAFVDDKPRGKRKLYISRSLARFRRVLNEKELEEKLKDYGFEAIKTDEWSLTEQIAAFSECETLIGIHGAGLTNCLFMPPGGKVIELRKREPNYGYWHLAESVGHKYYYYHGEPDSELSLIGRGCNLTIPVDDFEEKILKII
jgi:capsular polysaccharide biosynthesis protein